MRRRHTVVLSLRIKTLPALLCTIGALQALPVAAQRVPDAGQAVRELERPSAATQPPAKDGPQLQVQEERPALSAPAGQTIRVQTFTVTGSQRFTAAELASLLADLTGRELSLADLQAAAARITRYYRERGYPVARAYVPAQTLSNGTVEIAVLEGRLGKVELKNGARLSDDRVRAQLGAAQPGQAIESAGIERGLLLLNDTPGVGRTSAALQPGASVGLSDLVVAVEPGKLVSGSVDLDNHGNRHTGAYRLGGTVYVNSPLQLGDQLTARAVASDEQLYYGRVSYRIPVGASGLAVGAAYSASRYELAGAFSALDATGDARIATLFATYPLLRTQSANLSAALSGDHKTLVDRVGVVGTQSDKSIRSITAGLVGSARQSGAAYAFSAGYTAGRLDIDTAAVRIADSASARTQGDYGKFTYAASGTWSVSGPWSVYAGLLGQFASKNLDSSEKFSLGGGDAVRAYPQSEAPGDEGYLVTAELRHALSTGVGALQIGAFFDHGGVRINRNPFLPGDNTRRLSGTGLSLNWTAPADILVRASIAWKVGAADATSDTDRSPRAWLQAVKYF